MPRTSIRGGQRLINNRDGVKGDVTLNSQGKSIFGAGEPFLLEWLGLNGHTTAAAYFTLKDLEQDGIRCGQGVMPWASR
jgi:hypothetical protein